MTTTTSSTLSTPAWPTPDLVRAAETALAAALPDEHAAARSAYVAYLHPTLGRSAISGAVLPAFADCPPLVRAGWLAVARALRPLNASVVPVSSLPGIHPHSRCGYTVPLSLHVDPDVLDPRSPLLDLLFSPEWVTQLRRLAVTNVVGWREQLREAFVSREQTLPSPEAGDQVDPFLMGLQEIAGATRDLAEAASYASNVSDGELQKSVMGLVERVTKALDTRVQVLTADTPAAS